MLSEIRSLLKINKLQTRRATSLQFRRAFVLASYHLLTFWPTIVTFMVTLRRLLAF